MRAFVGFGELGRQIEGMLNDIAPEPDAWLFDDAEYARGTAGAYPFARCRDEAFVDCEFFVCLGYKHLRRKIELLKELTRLERALPQVIHASAYVSPSAEIGPGTVIYPLCNVDKQVRLASGVLLNNSVIVSHNSIVGEGSYLSPGVVLSGFVSVGAGSFLGSGAVVSDGVTIGDEVIVGVGTVVTGDVPSGASVIGNPMRILDRPLRL